MRFFQHVLTFPYERYTHCELQPFIPLDLMRRNPFLKLVSGNLQYHNKPLVETGLRLTSGGGDHAKLQFKSRFGYVAVRL